MNRTIALLFSMIILGATFSGCISDRNDTLDDEPDNSAELELQAKLNDLENQTLIYQIQINELLISLNNSASCTSAPSFFKVGTTCNIFNLSLISSFKYELKKYKKKQN